MSSLTSVNLNSLYAAFGSDASGIDVSTAVSQILYADRAIERQWQYQQSLISQQSSALNQLNSAASSLISSLDALQDPTGALMATNITSSDSSVVTATASPDTPSGSHVISVQKMATTAAWYSNAVSDANTAFSAGSFDLTIGSGSSQTVRTLVIGSGINTPNDLAAYVNGLKLGVTASVISDAKGARVALVSNCSGGAADFALAPNGSTSSNLFTRATTGANAALTVDGVPISSATNTVSGVINGVTLNLTGQASGEEVVLAVGPDSASAAQAVDSFVARYNNLVNQVSSQFAYSATSQSSGPLSADSTVRMLQSQLLAAPSYSTGAGTYSTLRSLGVTMNDDGTLAVDDSALSAILQNNPSAVQSLFQGASMNGFAANLKSALNTYADPSEGAFTVDLNSLTQETTDLQNQINDYEDYLSIEQARLTAQYNQANILLLQLPQQQKQLDAILGSSASGSSS
jgi:flagellar hook-associated protein 2